MPAIIRDFVADMGGSAAFWAVTAAVTLVAIAALVAGARPPRWLRARRALADMFDAMRVENERQTAEALIAAREAARS